MIKNAEEARLAIDFWNSDSMQKTLSSLADKLFAEGYLAALQGSEVKGLFEAAYEVAHYDAHPSECNPIHDKLVPALANFQALKEKSR